jgi:asparagine synthase (glutamine-hydrolysing)
MCGIVGVLGTGAGNPSHLDAMRRAVQHRGPDDCGIWFDEGAGVGLGHARLSIIDLTAAGHQPMHSTSGRYAMVFNGEIYNHTALRAELERAGRATGWRGHSDGETLCEGFDAWGIEATITRSVGMFALAVWDREARVLTLVRDRLGEKPLYYGWQGDVFLFGSELKALRAHPAFRAEIDRGALALLMRHNYIPAPHSIFQGIAKQLPGTLLTVSPREREIVARRYWDVREVVADGLAHPFEGSADEAVEAVRAQLREAIGQQMVADVPLGAFLSGGVDSSTVVAMMQEQSSRPVRTFIHRVPGRRIQRGRTCQGGGAAPRYRSHRTVCPQQGRRWRSFPTCPRCTASRSPIPRRSPPFWSASSRAST